MFCRRDHFEKELLAQGECVTRPVTKLVEDFVEAFNNHDALAIAHLFTPDATFVNLYGQFMDGRDGIELGHRAAFEHRLAVADLTIDGVDERSVHNDTVLLYVHWRLVQTDPGDLLRRVPEGRGILTAVAVQIGAVWLLRAATNVRSTPPPA